MWVPAAEPQVCSEEIHLNKLWDMFETLMVHLDLLQVWLVKSSWQGTLQWTLLFLELLFQTAFCDGKLKLQHPDSFNTVSFYVVEPRCCCPAAASGNQLVCYCVYWVNLNQPIKTQNSQKQTDGRTTGSFLQGRITVFVKRVWWIWRQHGWM